MKIKSILLAIAIIIVCSFHICLANTQTDVDIKDSRQWVIRYNKISKTTNVTIDAQYYSKSKKYIIKVRTTTDTTSFELVEPLNILYFQNQLNDKINNIANNNYLIAHSTNLEIFLWIYSLTDILAKPPLSGKLILNTQAVVYESKDSALKSTYEKRAAILNEALINTREQATLRGRAFRNWKNALKDAFMLDTAFIRRLDNLTESSEPDDYYLGITKAVDSAYVIYKTAIDKVNRLDSILVKNRVFPIKRISLQIERGFIERIQVWITSEYGRDMIFENIYAIGFSSITNFRDFETVKLVPRNGKGGVVFLSDIFSNYDNFLDNYTRDYSPADTTINNLIPESGSIIELRRERYVNLFDTKIYTDLDGLSNNSPNGLVQIELSRRFNIFTQRRGLRPRSDYGVFNYINVFGSYNKIEADQKYLLLKNENIIRNGIIVSPSYSSNLDIRRYENYAIGADANLVLFDFPDFKYSAYIDFGARYGHTPLMSIRQDIIDGKATASTDTLIKSAHTATFYPKLSIEIFAEKRVGINFSYQFNMTRLFNNNEFKQIASYAKSDLLSRKLEVPAQFSHLVEVFLRAETSADRNGRFFLRARFFLQNSDFNTFFPQFQLGYAYNLIFKK